VRFFGDRLPGAGSAQKEAEWDIAGRRTEITNQRKKLKGFGEREKNGNFLFKTQRERKRPVLHFIACSLSIPLPLLFLAFIWPRNRRFTSFSFSHPLREGNR
jgi:hypothetical protein